MSGKKTWQYRYELGGKEELATLGKYETMSLEEARKARMAARELVTEGTSPTAHQKVQKEKAIAEAHAAQIETASIFQNVAQRFFAVAYSRAKAKTRTANWSRLENHVLPIIGDWSIAQIERKEIVEVI